MARPKGIRLGELDPSQFEDPEDDLPAGSQSGSNGDSSAVAAEEMGLIPRPKLPDISGLLTADEEVADRVRQGAEKVRSWVVSTLASLSQISQGSRELREIRAPAVSQVKEELDRFLEKEEMPAYRRAAWLGLFIFEFSRELNGLGEVMALLSRLAAEGRLIDDPDGPIKKGYKVRADEPEKAYGFPEQAMFGEPEVKEISDLYWQCFRRAREAANKVKADEAQRLFGESDLSDEEFRDGKPGIFTVGVPPEPSIEFRTGKIVAWRGGGTLQVRSDGKKIFPMAATGNIQASVEEAISLRVFLLRDSLGWERPPWVRGLDENEELAMKKAKKVQFLWHIIQRGLHALEEARQLGSVKDGLVTLVTVSPEEFFLKDKPGKCLVEFRGMWEQEISVPVEDGEDGEEDMKFVYRPGVFFLAERFSQQGEDGDLILIRLKEVPEHLQEFLGECVGEYPEGGQFSGCPQPLRAVLRAVYGQTARAAQINGK